MRNHSLKRFALLIVVVLASLSGSVTAFADVPEIQPPIGSTAALHGPSPSVQSILIGIRIWAEIQPPIG
jgi:hypothetical protein